MDRHGGRRRGPTRSASRIGRAGGERALPTSRPVRARAHPRTFRSCRTIPTRRFFAGNSLDVSRPLLGYPSVVFTGKYADPIPLLQAASDAAAVTPPARAVRHSRSGCAEGAGRRRGSRAEDGQPALDVRTRSLTSMFYTHRARLPCRTFEQGRVIPLDFREAPVLRFSDPNDTATSGLPRPRSTRSTRSAAADRARHPTDRPRRSPTMTRPIRRRRATSANPFSCASPRIQRRDRADCTEPGRTTICGIICSPIPCRRSTGRVDAAVRSEASGGKRRRSSSASPRQIGVDHKGMTLVGKQRRARRVRLLAPDPPHPGAGRLVPDASPPRKT